MAAISANTPALQTTLHSVRESDEYRSVAEQIQRGLRVLSISGLVAAPARALVLAALQQDTQKQFGIVVPA